MAPRVLVMLSLLFACQRHGTGARAPLFEPLPVAAVAPSPPPDLAAPRDDEAEADLLLARLTVEQKVGQLMMVGFSGHEVTPEVEELVRGRQVGGVCLFKRNVASAEQLARLNKRVWGLGAPIPPFIAVDQEGGNVVRIAQGAVVLPGNMALAATRSTQLAYEAGYAQGEDLRLLGFNMNLAPVLDVNSNPHNPVIGIRSFGDQPQLVAELGADFVRGQQAAGIATVAKHFPGHGDTDADSHRSLPVARGGEKALGPQLEPFKAAIEEDLDGLMTAHVALPELTGDDVPATLSPSILTGLLRERIGFRGLVVTDELEMAGIAERYGVGRAAVLAVNAGADMVLVPWRPEKQAEVHQALVAAAQSEALTPRRLDEAVRRILLLKLKRGVFERPAPVEARLSQLGARREVAERIARASVTLVRSDRRHFPLAKTGRRIAVVTAEAALGAAIRSRSPEAQVLVVPAYPKAEQREQLKRSTQRAASQADVVVVGVINSKQLELVTMAALAGKPVVVVTMGLPYLADHVHEARAVLALYSYREVSANAAAAALFGEQGTPGRLPVRLPRHPFGHGLDPVGDGQRIGLGGSASAGSLLAR